MSKDDTVGTDDFDPVLEVVAEFRFDSSEQDAAAVLPGLLHANLKSLLPSLETLAYAQIPVATRKADAKLRYGPCYRITRDNHAGVLIGDQVIAVFMARPFKGWKTFKPLVDRVWRLVAASGQVGEVQRMSVKAVQMIPAPPGTPQLERTRVALSMGDLDIDTAPVYLRTTLPHNGFDTIVELSSQTSSLIDQQEEQGLVLSVDVVKPGPIEDFWNTYEADLEDLYDSGQACFDALLKPAAPRLERRSA